MDQNSRRTALRMIPYGAHVLAVTHKGCTAGTTISWLMQVSMSPPQLAVALKGGSEILDLVEAAGGFSVSLLGKRDKMVALDLYRTPFTELEGSLADRGVHFLSKGGHPILDAATAGLECSLIEKRIHNCGDHDLLVAEVVGAEVIRPVGGRPEESALSLADLGRTVFYGG